MEKQLLNQTDVGRLGRGEENGGASARDGAETARDRSPFYEEGRIAVVSAKAKPLRDATGKFAKAPSQGPNCDEIVRREDRVSTDVVLSSDVELLSDVENAKRLSIRRKRSSSFIAAESLDSDDTENEGTVAAKARRGKAKPLKAGPANKGFLKPAMVLLEDVLETRQYRKGSASPAASLTETETSPGLIQVTEGDLNRLNAQELKMHAGEKLNCILEVAKKSGNLKGEFVNRLKNSASTLREMVEVLASRSEAEETRRLRAENSRLRLEVEAIKAEVKALRRGFTEANTQAAAAAFAMPAPPATTLGAADLVEELKRSLTMTLGQMMDARLAGIEDRLLPAPTVRPPLRADAKKAAEAAAQPKPTPKPARNPTPKAGKQVGQAPKAATTPPMAPAAGPSTETHNVNVNEDIPSTAPQADAWTKVVRKGKGKSKGKGKGKPSPPSATPTAASGARSSKPKPAASSARTVMRPPKSAAVVVTLKPEAVEKGITYYDAIQEAQALINIQQLGIDQLRFRQTATGARMFEIPGSQNGEKADRLAEKLREVLSEVATIARPIKSIDLRITELNDAATKEKVAAAIAEASGCDVGQIKTGEIRRNSGGLGSILVSCPVLAAKAVLAKDKFVVGWTSVRVVALEVLPMRCFRCLGLGHTRPQCPESSPDRGALCFRCGGTGHQAASCEKVEPRCAICAELGKPSAHVMGGRKCTPPKTKGKATRTQAAPNEEVVMSDY